MERSLHEKCGMMLLFAEDKKGKRKHCLEGKV